MTMPTPGLPQYLIEWYRPELSADLLDRTAASLQHAAAAVSAEGLPVRLVLTIAVPTDEVIFGVFAAGSAQLVERACHRAGIPAERLTGAVSVLPEPRELPSMIETGPTGLPLPPKGNTQR
jgi:hypothetical protein